MAETSPPEALTCSICQELYRSAVTVTLCSHSFCSECIRQNLSRQYNSLKRTAECPLCRTSIFTRSSLFVPDKVLEPNRDIQECVYQYKHRSKEEEGTSSVPEDQSIRRSSRRRSSSSSSPLPLSPQQKPNPRLHKRTKVLYKNLKQKALETLLRDEGLPTHGNEQELKQRYERFVTCWDGFTDEVVDPPTRQQVLKYFLKIERSRTNKSKKKMKDTAKGFTSIRETILDTLADSWYHSNFALSILALTNHPDLVSTTSSLRNTLRIRAEQDAYGQQPLMDLLPPFSSISTNITVSPSISNAETVEDHLERDGPQPMDQKPSPKLKTSPKPSVQESKSKQSIQTSRSVLVDTTPKDINVIYQDQEELYQDLLEQQLSLQKNDDSITATTMKVATAGPVLSKEVKPVPQTKKRSTPKSYNQTSQVSSHKKKKGTTFFQAKTNSASLQKVWQWTCQVCFYENKLDRTSTTCGLCGKGKGTTFDDIYQEKAGSSGNPIQLS